MTIVSCAGRFHAFALAEQLEKHQLLSGFYTTYAYQKNRLMRRFTSRIDKENIPPHKIHTAVPIAIMMKRGIAPFITNKYFDRWVAGKLAGRKDYGVFIGWSGMSLAAIRRANKQGKITILERGSSHIQNQDQILSEEYKKFGIRFNIDPRVIDKELQEYEEADYISIPSTFVKNSFLEYGVPEEKLIQNPYGSGAHFKPVDSPFPKNKFRVLYMGSLTIQKGLIYLFEALNKLNIPESELEAWFVGKVDDEMKETVEQYARPNWNFFGHINYYKLPEYISACDVAVQPSLQEGLSMVIPQLMGCGVPVIATTNTGGEDVITNGRNGFIVPVQDSDSIAKHIQQLYENRERLEQLKTAAAEVTKRDFSWDNYGERYAKFIKQTATCAENC